MTSTTIYSNGLQSSMTLSKEIGGKRRHKMENRKKKKNGKCQIFWFVGECTPLISMIIIYCSLSINEQTTEISIPWKIITWWIWWQMCRQWWRKRDSWMPQRWNQNYTQRHIRRLFSFASNNVLLYLASFDRLVVCDLTRFFPFTNVKKIKMNRTMVLLRLRNKIRCSFFHTIHIFMFIWDIRAVAEIPREPKNRNRRRKEKEKKKKKPVRRVFNSNKNRWYLCASRCFPPNRFHHIWCQMSACGCSANTITTLFDSIGSRLCKWCAQNAR